MSPARLSATAALLTAVVYVFAVGTHAGRELERSVLAQGPTRLQDMLVAIMIVLINPATVALTGLAAMRQAFRAGGMRAAAGIAIALLGPVLAARGLKAALAALDPVGGEGHRALGRAFFPSGHVAVATSLGLIAIRAAAPRRRHDVALVVGAVLGAFGCLVFAGDNHHPLDVVGGALLAVAWVAALLAWWPSLGVGRTAGGWAGTVASRAVPHRAGLVIALATVMAGVLTLAAVLPWRPLLSASAIVVMLTTLGLALAFERALAYTTAPVQP